MKRKLLYLLTLASVVLFNACKKDNNEEPIVETTGIYLLFEGSYSAGNSGITYYDIKNNIAYPDYFKTVNGYSLGETATDLKQYGSKLYCVVSGSGNDNSYLEIIDVASCKSLKRIPFFNDSDQFMPRYIAFNKNKAYVSGYDGMITRVDTSSLEIEARVKAGGALEEIAVANGKIYVANSAHSLYPSENNNTVSVINIDSFTKLYNIEVGYNAVKLNVAGGYVYVASAGDYFNPAVKPDLRKIDIQTDKVVAEYPLYINSIAFAGQKACLAGDPYLSSAYIKPFDLATGQLGTDFITDGTEITNIYGLTLNPVSGDLCVADAHDYGSSSGTAYYFSASGKLRFKFETGVNPQHAVFRFSTTY